MSRICGLFLIYLDKLELIVYVHLSTEEVSSSQKRKKEKCMAS